jgi:hypothetical protein
MKAERIGRVLGIGLRVAGRLAEQQLNTPSRPNTAQSAASAAVAAQKLVSPQAVQNAGKAARSASRGLSGVFKPFRRAGGILWFQITGSFYLLFSLAFAGYLWKQRTDWAVGQNHLKLMIEAAMALIFLYLGTSAFWRAGQR